MGIEVSIFSRSIRTVWVGAVSVAALGACVSATTTPQDPPSPSPLSTQATTDAFSDDEFEHHDIRTTVRAGLKGISRRYIEPVDMNELALNGIRGLATIDPDLKVEIEDSEIHVHLNGKSIAEYSHPRGDKPARWADLTANIIRDARIQSNDLYDADHERVYEAVFDGMLAGLDIFSRYSGAEEARANRARRDGFGGIGIRFTKADNGILVTRVQDGGPAHSVGLKSGDLILKVNAENTVGLSLRKVAQRLRGPVGSPLTLNVARLNDDDAYPDRHISFNINRAHIVPETVHADIKNDILFMRVTGFNKKTSSSMHDILRAHDLKLKNGHTKGVVIDLRGNPGGLLSQSVSVSDLFLEQGRIIATRGRHPDSFHDYRAAGMDLIEGKPLVILVDGDSASAAEIVASALQDLGRAVVIGSTSYGKGTVQTVIKLPNDGEITLTWSRLVSPSGYALHGLGVMPAVCATNTSAITIDKRTTAAILAPEHIDGQRQTMAAWREAGMIFDGRRSELRHACPARTFKTDTNEDILVNLAGRVVHDPALYRRAILLSEPISTASR